MKKILLTFFLLIFVPLKLFALHPLHADQAFAFSTKFSDQNTLIAQWKIAPGYYLYREHFNFSISTPGPTRLGAIELPPGIPKQDDILGKYQVYENAVAIKLPLINPQPGQVTLQVGYQGCATSGFCYPPIIKQVVLTLSTPINSAAIVTKPPTTFVTTNTVPPAAKVMMPQDKVSQLLAGHNWLLIFTSFCFFGLLLAFTPCVLPMLPILSGIIVGQGRSITPLRAFGVSVAYVLGMSITYALAGVLAALAGSYVQAALQNPWVLGTFGLVFVVLALSLFGFYELRLPSSLHQNVTELSNRQRSGTYIGAAVMGCLSVLIVSPCVTAPLIGALSYIGKTGDVVLGGVALFALGLGMGIPLLIVGTLGGEFLPKASEWLNAVKAFFGVLLLGVAIELWSRIIPAQWTMFLWSSLAIVAAIYLGALTSPVMRGWRTFWKGLGVILLVYGIVIFIGALQGSTDPLRPLSIAKTPEQIAAQPAFQVVRNLTAVKQALAIAKAQSKPVLLDFYADWCISCKQMDRQTYSDPQVQGALRSFDLIRVDVTSNDADAQALLTEFGVIAPPTVLFFNAHGQELSDARVVGEMTAAEFLDHLQRLQVEM